MTTKHLVLLGAKRPKLYNTFNFRPTKTKGKLETVPIVNVMKLEVGAQTEVHCARLHGQFFHVLPSDFFSFSFHPPKLV